MTDECINGAQSCRNSPSKIQEPPRPHPFSALWRCSYPTLPVTVFRFLPAERRYDNHQTAWTSEDTIGMVFSLAKRFLVFCELRAGELKKGESVGLQSAVAPLTISSHHRHTAAPFLLRRKRLHTRVLSALLQIRPRPFATWTAESTDACAKRDKIVRTRAYGAPLHPFESFETRRLQGGCWGSPGATPVWCGA